MSNLRTKLLIWLAGNDSVAINIRFQDGRAIMHGKALIAKCEFVQTPPKPRKWWMFRRERVAARLLEWRKL